MLFLPAAIERITTNARRALGKRCPIPFPRSTKPLAAQTGRRGRVLPLRRCVFFLPQAIFQSVAWDREGSFPIAPRARQVKTLTGDNIPYFGGHVELSDGDD
jgi:hypothetical protein